MSEWSLPALFDSLNSDIRSKLTIVRNTFHHPGTKGDGSENAWLELFQTYLPARYQADKAHVVDSQGNFSEQIDIVIFDRQYSPFIFSYQGQKIIPVESVYAIFEAKQAANLTNIKYAQKKICTVRKLHRTSLPIPHAGGKYPPKPFTHILGGLLALESEWNPPLGEPLRDGLTSRIDDGILDIGCIAAHGYFYRDKNDSGFHINPSEKAATAFLFRLISEIQFSGTVPMIDVMAYAKWVED